MHTVQPLQEDRGALVGVHAGGGLATPVVKPVAKSNPLPLHQYLETLWIHMYTHTHTHTHTQGL